MLRSRVPVRQGSQRDKAASLTRPPARQGSQLGRAASSTRQPTQGRQLDKAIAREGREPNSGTICPWLDMAHNLAPTSPSSAWIAATGRTRNPSREPMSSSSERPLTAAPRIVRGRGSGRSTSARRAISRTTDPGPRSRCASMGSRTYGSSTRATSRCFPGTRPGPWRTSEAVYAVTRTAIARPRRPHDAWPDAVAAHVGQGRVSIHFDAHADTGNTVGSLIGHGQRCGAHRVGRTTR